MQYEPKFLSTRDELGAKEKRQLRFACLVMGIGALIPLLASFFPSSGVREASEWFSAVVLLAGICLFFLSYIGNYRPPQQRE
ncbi:MAG: hypothetical protein ACLQMT_12860 [Candidatus Acidiferrales bacterium]